VITKLVTAMFFFSNLSHLQISYHYMYVNRKCWIFSFLCNILSILSVSLSFVLTVLQFTASDCQPFGIFILFWCTLYSLQKVS